MSCGATRTATVDTQPLPRATLLMCAAAPATGYLRRTLSPGTPPATSSLHRPVWLAAPAAAPAVARGGSGSMDSSSTSPRLESTASTSPVSPSRMLSCRYSVGSR